jgi:uncharacterized protein YvpB
VKLTLTFVYAGVLVVLLAVGYVLWINSDGEPSRTVQYGKEIEREKMEQTLTKDATGPQKSSPSVKVETKHPTSIMLDAPLINQNPQLDNGCEITSLTMMLQYAGVAVDKMELAKAMPKDKTPLKRDRKGNIVYWGNPNSGFVGDVTGKNPGYAIYHGPLYVFTRFYLKTAVDLTNSPYKKLEQKLAQKKPVLVWTTNHYDVPRTWQQWDTPSGPIRTTREEHAVLLVGYDSKYVYVNDPLSYRKQQRIDKNKFKRGWQALGRQAISY